MSDYRRFVSYIYAYKNGKKEKNTGFAKVEARSGNLKINIQLENVQNGSERLDVYGFVRKGEKLYGIPLGELSAGNRGALKINTSAANVAGSGYGLRSLSGLWIKGNQGENYITIWDDDPVTRMDLEVEIQAEPDIQIEEDSTEMPHTEVAFSDESGTERSTADLKQGGWIMRESAPAEPESGMLAGQEAQSAEEFSVSEKDELMSEGVAGITEKASVTAEGKEELVSEGIDDITEDASVTDKEMEGAVFEEADGIAEGEAVTAEGNQELMSEDFAGITEDTSVTAEGNEELTLERVGGIAEEAPVIAGERERLISEEGNGIAEEALVATEGSEGTISEGVDGITEEVLVAAEGSEGTIPEEIDGITEEVLVTAEGSKGTISEGVDGIAEEAPVIAEGNEKLMFEEADGNTEDMSATMEKKETMISKDSESTAEKMSVTAEGQETTIAEDDEDFVGTASGQSDAFYREKAVADEKGKNMTAVVSENTRNESGLRKISTDDGTRSEAMAASLGEDSVFLETGNSGREATISAQDNQTMAEQADNGNNINGVRAREAAKISRTNTPPQRQLSQQNPRQNFSGMGQNANPAAQGTAVNENERNWNMLSRTYPHINPFPDGQVMDCVRITPRELYLFRRKEWNAPKNNFMLHGYYKFHHILFGMQPDGTYFLGVPGYFTIPEQRTAASFGFPFFKDVRDSGRIGRQGYWCRLL